MNSRFTENWFKVDACDNGISRIYEPRIKPGYRANMWHVRGRDRDLMIDTGFGIASLIDSVKLLDQARTLAVATHSHCDHIGGHHEFNSVAIHRAEADILRNPTMENTVAASYVCRDMFFDPEDGARFNAENYRILGAHPTRLLVDGDVVDLGDRSFEVLHLPGHSPGGIGLFETRTGILFSGDMVHNGTSGIGRYMLYHSDLDDWLASAERLRRLPVTIVHAGHFDSFGRDRYIEIIDEYLAWRNAKGSMEFLSSY